MGLVTWLTADWRERCGVALPPVQPGSTWIVASSVGEVRAAAALATALEGPVLITADTDTGAAVARGLPSPAGRRPIDHPWTLAPLWAEARPRRLVWVEGAWWPALDRLAKRAGVPTVRVNARASRSGVLRIALGLEAQRVVCRDPDAVAWFRARGVEAWLGGELKADAPIGANPLRWSRPFGVAGPTRPGDEAALIEAGTPLQWLIAPRHLERVDQVAAALAGRRWVRRSALVAGAVPQDVDFVLLDTLGELDACYRGAAVAFIGGSFDKNIGGHSPIEAWRAGVPVVCGPEIGGHRASFEACAATTTTRPALAGALEGAIGSRVPPPPVGAARVSAACVEALSSACPETSPRPWARPASWVHRVARRGWHAAWDTGLRTPVRLSAPVVSVGSANARSPGKTATVRWVLEELARRGHRPGVAVRGYRRAATGLAGSWEGAGADRLGDEGALLAREGWPVAACSDRVQAGRALVERGVDVVVLDDGLQHRHLHRDLDLVVVDGRYPRGRGELPMGEAREDAVPERAHGVVLHHGGAFDCRVPVARAVRAFGPWTLGDRPAPLPEGGVAAFAGIGRPADFASSLERVERFRALPDHQPVDDALARELVSWAGGLPLLCTDKDHVRLPPWLAARTWWRTVRLEVSGAPESWFSLVPAA